MSIRPIDLIMPIYISENSLYPVVERCLHSLSGYYPDIQLILVNDASPLPIPEDWKKNSSTYIKHGENKGYTAAVNSGLEASEGKVTIIANDDLVFHEACLDRFYNLEGLVIASPSDTAASADDRFGSIWGMTRQTYRLLGPLEERLKHFFSDLEYYERAKANNVRIEKWHDVILEHQESATYKTVDKERLYQIDLETYGSDKLERAEW